MVQTQASISNWIGTSSRRSRQGGTGNQNNNNNNNNNFHPNSNNNETTQQNSIRHSETRINVPQIRRVQTGDITNILYINNNNNTETNRANNNLRLNNQINASSNQSFSQMTFSTRGLRSFRRNAHWGNELISKSESHFRLAFRNVNSLPTF